MGNVPINIGLAANDHTGDPLRTAYDKINKSFSFVVRLMGDHDLSTNLMPAIGQGSGVSGVVEIGNVFIVTTASTSLTVGGGLIDSGTLMMARVTSPSTTEVTDWIFFYTIH